MLRHNLMMSVPNVCFAYDANDPADKVIVKKLIDAALAEAQTEHEQDVAGLKTKRDELLAQVRELKAGKVDTQALEKLEETLEATKTELKTAQKELKKITTERDEFKTNFETSEKTSRDMLIESQLTEALTKANVNPAFIPAVKALHSGKIEVKAAADGTKQVVVGDKPLGEFITAWSQGDDGKHYVAAPVNGGTGATGGNKVAANPNAIKLSRAEYEANPGQYGAQLAKGEVVLTDG
jgi:hypothetical protein